MIQIRFVTNQHNYHIRRSILTSFCQPLCQLCESLTTCDIIHKKSSSSSSVIRTSNRTERFLTSLQQSVYIYSKCTVSQIWSFTCFSPMLIILAPNSTPIVRSCTGWNRLSVNWRSRQDFPTPMSINPIKSIFCIPVSPMIIYLKR